MKPQHPMKIRVMADYGSSGNWAFSDPPATGFRHGMLEHHRLKLPKTLSDGFDQWIRRYEDEAPSDRLDIDAFNADGLRLAILLKQHLGPDRHVEYQGEGQNGAVLAPVLIHSPCPHGQT
ncbi:MAG: hypothetical protein AB1899_03065 [Pseudomonadota bacterium]